MNDVVHRRECPEVLPDGRHPRQCDARDVARETVAMIATGIYKVALYITPDGRVLRSYCRDDDFASMDVCSLIGVYD